MQELTLRECQQEALKVLIRFDKICKENKFKYFLVYGTLLGAIRHNGFIPWDDDLDVMMPREDFDKFIKYARTSEKALYPFKLCDRLNTENYSYGIPRFANQEFKYVVESQYEKPFDLGIFIDIYPLDNYGNTQEEASALFKYCAKLNRQFGWYINPASSRGFLGTFLKHILHYYMRLMKGTHYSQLIDAQIKSYILTNTSKNNQYVGLVAWASKVVLYEKSKLEGLETVNHVFEDHVFPIPKCYDYMLKQSYGDYMQLPPIEERVPYHGYKIYKR